MVRCTCAFLAFLEIFCPELIYFSVGAIAFCLQRPDTDKNLISSEGVTSAGKLVNTILESYHPLMIAHYV